MEAFVFLTFPELITVYNIARVLAQYKSYWAAMKKIFIYARPCINKMTWAFFFTWLKSFRPVKLQCSFPSLWNMEETSEELPSFPMSIDLLSPDPTSIKLKPEKNSEVARFANWHEFIWLWFSPFSPKMLSFSFTVIGSLDQMISLKPKYTYIHTYITLFDNAG